MAAATVKEENRLWIGNLDARVNEFQLLKLLQKHGTIKKFDLLFHKTGPLTGQPRGYAFVTYSNTQEAEKAKKMHNMLLGSKKIIVTCAHSIPTDIQEEQKKPDINIPALAINKKEKACSTDKEFQIQAIEAKLKLMESQSTKGLEINKTVSHEHPVISMYQQKQNKEATSTISSSRGSYKRYNDRTRDRRPYNRHRRM